MNTVKSLVLAAVVLLTPCSLFAQQQNVTVTTTEAAGTVSEFSPDAIVVRTETNPSPISYTYTKTTTYVDEAGAPVSLETVKSGLPVTIYYTNEGEKMIANKVVVRKVTTTETK